MLTPQQRLAAAKNKSDQARKTIEDALLVDARKLKSSDKSPEAQHLREVAGSIRDHRAAEARRR